METTNLAGASISGSNIAVGNGIQQTILYAAASAVSLPAIERDYPETKPPLQEIYEYIEKLSPYEQQMEITAYNGLEVSWVVLFSEIESYGASGRKALVVRH